MRRPIAIAVLAAMTVTLAGCESARKVIGRSKDAPDEFVVYERPPLSLPPEFGLRPPEPGSSRPQAITPTDQAQAALLQRSASVSRQQPKDPTVSDGLNVILRETGGNQSDPSIREVVNQETSILTKEDQRLVDKMIFWIDQKPYQGTIVDSAAEQKRIQENQALGKTVTEGETPQIKLKRERKGILDF